MSADANAGPEVNAPVDAGPVIITVVGQEGYVAPEVKVAEPVVEVKEPVVEAKKDATGLEEQVDGENRDEKGRFKNDAKTRIDQLTRARRDAERDAAHWKAVAEGKVSAKAADPANPPKRDAFQSDEEFQQANFNHQVEVEIANREQKNAVNKAATEKAESWQSKLDSARNEIPDFDSVMDAAEIRVEGHVAELIMEHDDGAKIAHHFATHPEELDKVNGMTPAKAAFEIQKITAKFGSAADSSSKPAAKVVKVSEAPPPAARNVGSGRSTTIPLGEMSMEDYVATRKSQGASWAR